MKCLVFLSVVAATVNRDEVVISVLDSLGRSPELLNALRGADPIQTKLAMISASLPENVASQLNHFIAERTEDAEDPWPRICEAVFERIAEQRRPDCQLMALLISAEVVSADFVRDQLRGRMTLDEFYAAAAEPVVHAEEVADVVRGSISRMLRTIADHLDQPHAVPFEPLPPIGTDLDIINQHRELVQAARATLRDFFS